MTSTPGADPALYETDPVFVEYFNAWVRGETDADSAVLTARVRQLVRLASVVGANGVPRFTTLAAAALDTVLTPVELKELVYQAVPYVGYATASDFLRATNDLLRERGVQLPLPDQAPMSPDDRFERGRALQARTGGRAAADPAAGDTAHLDRYVTGHVHGDVLARGGLDLGDRLLVTVALLVALGAAAPQLAEQVRAAMHVGHDRAVLVAVLTALVPAIGLPRVQQALAVVDTVSPAASPPPPTRPAP